MTDPQGKGPNQSHSGQPSRPDNTLPTPPNPPNKPDNTLPTPPTKPDNTLPDIPERPDNTLPSPPNRPGHELPNPPNKPGNELPETPNRPGHDLPEKPDKPNRPTNPIHNRPEPKESIVPPHGKDPDELGNKPDWNPEEKEELTGDEKKGIKRLGTPTTQAKVANLGTVSKDEANMELNQDPRARRVDEKKEEKKGEDSQLPNIESDRTKPQTEEEKFINQDNPDFSPGYMHDHDSKVSQDDKVGFTQTDKSSTVRVPPRARFPFQIPEPLIGNEVPNPQILPQNKEDLLTTIRSILKVTSADSQQIGIAMDRIASLLPATYTPRSFPNQRPDPNPFDDSSKSAMTNREYNRNKEHQNA